MHLHVDLYVHVTVCIHVAMCTCMYTCTLSLKLGQVIWVAFCPGQASLTWFIKYLSLSRILHWIPCVDNSICCDQSNELSVLDSYDGSVSPDSPQVIRKD